MYSELLCGENYGGHYARNFMVILKELTAL